MSPELLAQSTGCGLLRASNFAPHLVRAMHRWGIDTPVRQAAFLGQIAHESMSFSVLEENLHYTALRLTQVWPKRFPTLADAAPYANNPEALAEKVYGKRMGNGTPGDAFRYRGRGLKQLTGKENYLRYMMATGADVLTNPHLVSQPAAAADSAAWFWSENRCNVFADARDWDGLTRRINGGLIGQADRVARINKALKALTAC